MATPPVEPAGQGIEPLFISSPGGRVTCNAPRSPGSSPCISSVVVGVMIDDAWHWFCPEHLEGAEAAINRLHMIATLWGFDNAERYDTDNPANIADMAKGDAS